MRHELRAPLAAVEGAPESGDGLGPPEDLLDASSDLLADRISDVARCPFVDRRAAAGLMLRHVRRRTERSAVIDEVTGVMAAVRADGGSGGAIRCCQHPEGHLALGGARRWTDLQVDEQAVPVSTRAWPMYDSFAGCPESRDEKQRFYRMARRSATETAAILAASVLAPALELLERVVPMLARLAGA